MVRAIGGFFMFAFQFIFLDAETFYSTEYTLKKMDPPSYILDPRFELICLGVAEGLENKPYIVDGPNVPAAIEGFKYRQSQGVKIAAVSHNQLFDACIWSWRYDWVPDLIVDTLAMARTLLQHKLKSCRLESVAEYFGLQKGDTIYQVIGMTRADIIANGLWDRYLRYCLNDTVLCREIFLKLVQELPPEELILHDIIARCAVQPVLELDMDVLAENLANVQANKDRLFNLARFAGLQDEAQLMSNPQFANLLEDLSVDPPTKKNAKGEITLAMAKNDPAFLELLDHDDLRVRALMEARFAFKTTLEETRTERMMNIGTLEFFPHKGKRTGLMPIPLIVGAAHTHRLGGGWQLNCQNWGRKSLIRKSIKAPPGHVIMVADARQIEARMNAWFCSEMDLLQQFRDGVDVYALFASIIYKRPINKDDHPKERFIGKTGVLQLGYQAGWRKFQGTVWIQSYDDPDGPIELSEDEARQAVWAYRTTNSRIKAMWEIIPLWFPILAGDAAPREFKCLKIEKGRIVGPNGLCLYYDNVNFNHDNGEWSGQWTYDYNDHTYKIYGGKGLENMIQFLSRIATMQAAIRLKKPMAELHSRLTHTSHDELVYLVPYEFVEDSEALLRTEMRRAPDWAPSLPLDVDIGVGLTYADAK
jgi:DNA polymerase family A